MSNSNSSPFLSYSILTGQSAEELNGYVQYHLDDGWDLWGVTPYGFSYVIDGTVWEKH